MMLSHQFLSEGVLELQRGRGQECSDCQMHKDARCWGRGLGVALFGAGAK